MYSICFKIDPCEAFPSGLSDHLGVNFKTIAAAEDEIATIRKNPGLVNCIDEMQDASLWVVDENGNFA